MVVSEKYNLGETEEKIISSYSNQHRSWIGMGNYDANIVSTFLVYALI
jgi:hypothetical protein